MKVIAISKTLSANDVGATGGHQAGILIPRDPDILQFMPRLNTQDLNPRIALQVTDTDSGVGWAFNFIYYNNKLVANGTRNEYRLTGMTKYLRTVHAQSGDTLVFTQNRGGEYHVQLSAQATLPDFATTQVLVLKGTWKVIST